MLYIYTLSPPFHVHTPYILIHLHLHTLAFSEMAMLNNFAKSDVRSSSQRSQNDYSHKNYQYFSGFKNDDIFYIVTAWKWFRMFCQKIPNNSICSGFLSSTIEPKIPRDLSSRLLIVRLVELCTEITIQIHYNLNVYGKYNTNAMQIQTHTGFLL